MVHPLKQCLAAMAAVILALSAALHVAWADEPPASSRTSPGHSSPADRYATKPAVAAQKIRNPRVLFITAKDSSRCDDELARLNRTGGDFPKLRSAGWTIGPGPENMIQLVDANDVPELVAKLDAKEFPAVACIDHGEIVRYFRFGCTTPLDMWTFDFLAKGIDKRPPGAVLEAARVEATGSYRLRGNHWSVEGDWSPTRDKVIAHLRGPNHLAELIPAWHIDDWSLEELRSLHDDLHEKYDTGTYTNSRNSSGSGYNPATDYLRFKGHS